VRVLQGEPATNFAARIIGPLEPRYDWRELQHWHIPENRLLPGSTVLFRAPTLWERHKWRIIAVAAVVLIQAAIISVLLTNLVRRRRAERSLRESDKRMMMASEAANLGMWIWEPPGTEMWASENWKRIHGYSLDAELRCDGLIKRIHPQDREGVERAIADVLNSRGAFHVEHRIVLPDGSVRWIAKSGRLEETTIGRPQRLLGICIDISERREAEEITREVSGKLITAHEDERRRIARDLHDDLNQRLALLSVETDLLGQMHNDPSAQALITNIGTGIHDLSSEVHRLSYQLHPAKLEQLGLIFAARSFCHELSRRCGVPVEFVHDEITRDLDRDVALCLYRLIQEGLQNMLKHSHATSAQVRLRIEGKELKLVVSDNGRGFNPSRITHHAGLGLLGMRERVRLVHGLLEVHSASGKGTRIEVTVPWNAKDIGVT
jgi:PAS domain S-box-containing protein